MNLKKPIQWYHFSGKFILADVPTLLKNDEAKSYVALALSR
jgi:hypothetical protein